MLKAIVGVAQGGNETFNTVTLTGPALSQHPVVANSGAAYTIDQANGAQFDITLNSATPTLTLQSVNAGKTQTLPVTLIQDGTGGRAPSWSNVTWAAGVTPTVASAIAARTYLEFISDGVTWTGYAVNPSTGTGATVLQTSPTLITPALGTPGSGILTSCTGLPLTTGVTGILAGTNGGTGVNNGALLLTYGSTANLFFVNVQTGTTYTIVAADNGKIITFNNASAITVTLPQQSTLTTSAGFTFKFQNIGIGTITFVKEGSETTTGNTIAATGASGFIWRNTTTNWNIFGGTSTLNMPGINTLIQTVANNTYTIMGYVGTPITILGAYQKARALTTAGTFSININGTGITSLTAVVPSTGGSYTTATGLNTCVRGDQITVVFSGTSLVLDQDIGLDITQQF